MDKKLLNYLGGCALLTCAICDVNASQETVYRFDDAVRSLQKGLMPSQDQLNNLSDYEKRACELFGNVFKNVLRIFENGDGVLIDGNSLDEHALFALCLAYPLKDGKKKRISFTDKGMQTLLYFIKSHSEALRDRTDMLYSLDFRGDCPIPENISLLLEVANSIENIRIRRASVITYEQVSLLNELFELRASGKGNLQKILCCSNIFEDAKTGMCFIENLPLYVECWNPHLPIVPLDSEGPELRPARFYKEVQWPFLRGVPIIWQDVAADLDMDSDKMRELPVSPFLSLIKSTIKNKRVDHLMQYAPYLSRHELRACGLLLGALKSNRRDVHGNWLNPVRQFMDTGEITISGNSSDDHALFTLCSGYLTNLRINDRHFKEKTIKFKDKGIELLSSLVKAPQIFNIDQYTLIFEKEPTRSDDERVLKTLESIVDRFEEIHIYHDKATAQQVRLASQALDLGSLKRFTCPLSAVRNGSTGLWKFTSFLCGCFKEGQIHVESLDGKERKIINNYEELAAHPSTGFRFIWEREIVDLTLDEDASKLSFKDAIKSIKKKEVISAEQLAHLPKHERLACELLREALAKNERAPYIDSNTNVDDVRRFIAKRFIGIMPYSTRAQALFALASAYKFDDDGEPKTITFAEGGINLLLSHIDARSKVLAPDAQDEKQDEDVRYTFLFSAPTPVPRGVGSGLSVVANRIKDIRIVNTKITAGQAHAALAALKSGRLEHFFCGAHEFATSAAIPLVIKLLHECLARGHVRLSSWDKEKEVRITNYEDLKAAFLREDVSIEWTKEG